MDSESSTMSNANNETNKSQKVDVDDTSDSQHEEPQDIINLPYRTLTPEARMQEYTTETAQGHVLKRVSSHTSGRLDRYELVTFTTGDAENPKNWSKARKWWCTMAVAITCFCVAFNSAVVTADVAGVVETFDVSEEVALLSVSLFVVGFGVGPMVFAPLSEICGRRPIYASTLLIAVIFVIPCAVAKNIETLLVCRLIDGIAFSAPMTLGESRPNFSRDRRKDADHLDF